jgi:hypothetical protein
MAFASVVEDVKESDWTCSDDDEVGTHIMIGERDTDDEVEMIDGFSINRPPTYEHRPEFWIAQFEVLQQTRTFLAWPDDGRGPTYCIGDADVEKEIPAQYITDFARPAVISSGADRVAILDGNWPPDSGKSME